MKVMKIIGLVNGPPTSWDGEYIVGFDVTDWRMDTTPEIELATRFDPGDALELWRTIDPENPVRGDGKPNRPFTAFTVELLPAPEEATA